MIVLTLETTMMASFQRLTRMGLLRPIAVIVHHQVIDVKSSSVSMVPSKVEVVLRKADQVSWGKLEDPNYKPEPEPEDPSEASESFQPDWDIADDDISDSDDDWAYDTPEYRKKKQERDSRNKEQEQGQGAAQNEQRREVEEELKRAAEERKKAEEERRKQEEQWRKEEEGEYEDMPELE